jgi:hypothetical protein
MNAELLPKHLQARPQTADGQTIPYIAKFAEGECVPGQYNAELIEHCMEGDLCPFCGVKLGQHRVVVFCPTQAVLNRATLVPASHGRCAAWAASTLLAGAKLITIEDHGTDHVARRIGDENFVVAAHKPKSVTWWSYGQVITDRDTIIAHLAEHEQDIHATCCQTQAEHDAVTKQMQAVVHLLPE